MGKSIRFSRKRLQEEEDRVRMTEGGTVSLDRDVALQLLHELKVLRFKVYRDARAGMQGR